MKYDLVTELASKRIIISKVQANALRTIFTNVVPQNIYVSEHTSNYQLNMKLPNSNRLMINFDYSKENNKIH